MPALARKTRSTAARFPAHTAARHQRPPGVSGHAEARAVKPGAPSGSSSPRSPRCQEVDRKLGIGRSSSGATDRGGSIPPPGPPPGGNVQLPASFCCSLTNGLVCIALQSSVLSRRAGGTTERVGSRSRKQLQIGLCAHITGR